MKRSRYLATVLVLLLGVTGCATGAPGEAPASSTGTEKGEAVESELTWQEAKARTLAMQLEVAKLIPKDKVVKINHKKTGTLLSCSRTLFNWNGSTTATLSKDTEVEPVVMMIEEHYQDSRFKIKTRTDPSESYEVQLRSPDTAEIYIISAGWDPDTIRIASGSPCFTLPEGVYPGGDF